MMESPLGQVKAMVAAGQEHRRQKDAIKGVQQAVLGTEAPRGHVGYRVPTGVGVLDILLGGGWPASRIAELTGPWGSGKSTLMLQAMSSVIAAGGVAVLINTERGFDADRATALGLDPAQILVVDVETMEDGFFFLRQFLERVRSLPQVKPETPVLVCWDTVSGTKTVAEEDYFRSRGKAYSQGMISRPRVLRLLLRGVTGPVAQAQAVCILATQTIDGPGAGFEVTVGRDTTRYRMLESGDGGGIKFYSSTRVHLGLADMFLDVETGEVQGNQVVCLVRKSRITRPYVTVRLPLWFRSGFDCEGALYQALADYPVAEPRGSWTVVPYGDVELKWQNQAQFRRCLEKHDGAREHLLDLLRRTFA